MTVIASSIFFAVGVYLSVRTIAALYRVIDLSYALRREWFCVARTILVWSAATAVAATVADRAFYWGFCGYAAVFATLSLSTRVWLSFRMRD